MEVLLQHGADLNAVNKSSCSPLHVAANKQFLHCVQVLIKHKADVNIQVICHVKCIVKFFYECVVSYSALYLYYYDGHFILEHVLKLMA